MRVFVLCTSVSPSWEGSFPVRVVVVTSVLRGGSFFIPASFNILLIGFFFFFFLGERLGDEAGVVVSSAWAWNCNSIAVSSSISYVSSSAYESSSSLTRVAVAPPALFLFFSMISCALFFVGLSLPIQWVAATSYPHMVVRAVVIHANTPLSSSSS